MAVTPPRPQRVPAWKRIGLKLTHAQDQAEGSSPDRALQPSADPPASPLIGHSISIDTLRPQKRRRTSPETPHNFQTTAKCEVHRIPSPDLQPQANDVEVAIKADPPVPQKPVRRKSVTFTAETKQEDGIDNSVSRQRPTSERIVQQLDKERSSSERTSTETNTSTPSKKRSFSDKSKRPITQDPPAFINYLTQFHTNKSSWKFNKKKQNDLFKNLYDIDLLPSKHNEAIVSYILGLESANAINRIQESSRAVLDEIVEKSDLEESLEGRGSGDGEDMEYAEARLNAYHQALERNLERFSQAGARRNEYDDHQFEEMRRETERGERAERILSELWKKNPSGIESPGRHAHIGGKKNPYNERSSANIEEPLPSPAAVENGVKEQSSKPGRKRKLRTQDTISTDSENENESEPHREKAPVTIHDALSSGKEPIPIGKIDINRKNPSKKIFDDDLLDQLFPKPKSYHETAPKRKAGAPAKARGFAYTHGTRADESGSEDD